MEIERSDVDIAKLFRWGNKITLLDEFGNEKISAYLRVVGDAEINRARVGAIRKSAELRKRLKTPGTEDRFVFIDNVMEMIVSKDDLVERILLLQIRPITQRVVKEQSIIIPKTPRSDAELEEQEEYQKVVDAFPENRNKELKRKIEEEVKLSAERLVKESMDTLKLIYENLMINELCEQEMFQRYKDLCVFYGSFKDENYKDKLFSNFDEYDNLPTQVKEQLLNNYQSLEINMDELKKLQEAAQ